MTFRGQHVLRCSACLLEATRCLCDAIPAVAARTRVVVLIDAREMVRPTNTGRFVSQMLPNGRLVPRGIRGVPDEPLPDLGPGPRFVLHPDATRELTAADAASEPVLLVPDGTWSQARRMLRRVPDLVAATRVRLPPGPPGRYRLRHHPDANHLSTLEAVARAVAVLDGPEAAGEMEAFFDTFVAAMLRTRGVDPTKFALA